jgi:hypothetical protein
MTDLVGCSPQNNARSCFFDFHMVIARQRLGGYP